MNAKLRSEAPVVLLVASEPGLWLRLFSKLEEAGYAVWRASDIAEAIKVLNVLPVRLILSRLPQRRTSGYQALAALRQNPKNASVPVVMITSPGEEAPAPGVPTVVNEPGQTGHLLAIVRRELGEGEIPIE